MFLVTLTCNVCSPSPVLGCVGKGWGDGLVPIVSDGPKSRGVHCENIRKQRAGKYRVIYIHKRKNLEFS